MTKVLALNGLCLGFPDGAVVKSPPANARGTGLILESERSPGVGKQPTSVFLPGKFHGQSSLAGYSPWGRRVGHD